MKPIARSALLIDRIDATAIKREILLVSSIDQSEEDAHVIQTTVNFILKAEVLLQNNSRQDIAGSIFTNALWVAIDETVRL